MGILSIYPPSVSSNLSYPQKQEAMTSSGRVPFAKGTVPSASSSSGVKPGRPPGVVSIPSSPLHGSVGTSTGSGRWASAVLEVDNGYESRERCLFGKLPTEEELEEAILAIEKVHFLRNLSQVSEDVNEIRTHSSPVMTFMDCRRHPTLQICNLNTEKTMKVVDSSDSLQTDPSIKRMVLSLSSDKAVWDAIMNNESVKQLREFFCAGERIEGNSSKTRFEDDIDTDIDISTRILNCFLEKIKGKLMELINSFQKVVDDFLHKKYAKEKVDAFEEAVRSSFMLAVVVIMVVVFFRDQRVRNS